MPSKRKLVLGSRGSQLALWQANFVKKSLEDYHKNLQVTIKVIKTTGDKIASKPLWEIGGKALFLKEIEEALQKGTIDVGVHSMKDVPAVLPPGLEIGAILKRGDPRDVFISHKYESLLNLPKKARIGTGSLRRKSQIKNFRPDFEVVPLRGNVETRMAKLKTAKLDAIVLAAAGVIRLGMEKKITEYLPTSLILPAVGQGAIGIEFRSADEKVRALIDPLNDVETAIAVNCERSWMKTLSGDCQSPVAAFAEVTGQNLKITAMVASPEGRDLVRDRAEGNIREAAPLGERLARQLLTHGAREILRSCRAKS